MTIFIEMDQVGSYQEAAMQLCDWNKTDELLGKNVYVSMAYSLTE